MKYLIYEMNTRKVTFFMFSLPIKEMVFFKVKYLLISFILFFLAILVFVITGLANGLSMDNASSIINMPAKTLLLQENAKERIDRSQLKLDRADLKKYDEAQPIRIKMGALSTDHSTNKLDITFMAVNSGSFLEPEVVEGKGLKESSAGSAVVDQSLKSQTVRIGTIVRDEQSGMELEITGFTRGHTFSHTPVVLVSLETWDQMISPKEKDVYSAVILKNNSSELQKEISSLVENGEWIAKQQVVKGIPGYTAEQNSLYMMLSFLIVIAVFVLGAFFYIMTIQKTAQFGILKAIGAKSSHLVKSTIFQVIILTLLNIAAAIGFTRVFMMVLPNGIPFIFDITQILTFSGILFLVSVFGSLLSVTNIVKADPVQAMGRLE
jgi:putative ABC transport system permease protein